MGSVREVIAPMVQTQAAMEAVGRPLPAQRPVGSRAVTAVHADVAHAAPVATAVAVGCVLLTLVGLAFVIMDLGADVPVTTASRASSTLQSLLFLALPILGLLIARRHPRHPVGALLSGIGVTIAVWFACDGWAVHTLVVEPGSGSGGQYAAWVANWIWTIGWALTAFLFLLFPSGALPSRGWRAASWVGAATAVLATASYALTPGPLAKYPYVDNPFGVGGDAVAALRPASSGLLPLVAFGAVAVGSLVLRYRRTSGRERRQLEVLAVPAVAVVAAIAVLEVLYPLGIRFRVAEELTQVATAAIPVAAGVAVLRHRLYDVGRLLNRTIVYTLLTGLLGTFYAGGVVLLGNTVGPIVPGMDIAVAGSTLLTASAAQPARRRIQQAVDRRFYRRSGDVRELVDAYRTQLRTELDLDAVADGLLRTASDAFSPQCVSVWLRAPRPAQSGVASGAPHGEAGGRAARPEAGSPVL